jgi:hypothetical protein
MHVSLDPHKFRQQIRDEIKRLFDNLVGDIRKGTGSFESVAAQIGVSRTMLPNYAKGSIPEADVLLIALLRWDWHIRIKETGGTPRWCEFGLSEVEGGIERRKAEPTQLSLFDALEDLDQSIDTLKKSVGRAEAEIRRAFSGKRRSA